MEGGEREGGVAVTVTVDVRGGCDCKHSPSAVSPPSLAAHSLFLSPLALLPHSFPRTLPLPLPPPHLPHAQAECNAGASQACTAGARRVYVRRGSARGRGRAGGAGEERLTP